MKRDNGPDIVRWIIERFMAHEDSITEELALTVEREARQYWGGAEAGYIAKTCSADRQAVRQAVQAAPPEPGLTAEEQARRHGISRATLYRLVSRNRKA